MGNYKKIGVIIFFSFIFSIIALYISRDTKDFIYVVPNIKNFEHLVRLLDEVITSYKTWASSDARKFKYLPSKKEFYKRLEEQNQYRKLLKAQEESMKRDEDGFIFLRRKAGK